MKQYVSQRTRTGNTAIDDPANALLLRADLYRAFDNLQFIFMPKANGVLVTHVLHENIELCSLYHNATLHQARVGPQFCLVVLHGLFSPCLGALFKKANPDC